MGKASTVVGVRPIEAVGAELGLGPAELEPMGRSKAKLDLPDAPQPIRGKLILVTAMTPTRSGSGKTVTSIGLGEAFGRLGLSHCVCLREPSLGPTFGIKGGGAGGGRAALVPMQDINLHFTGDLHAVGAAHNLLSAMVDNRVHFDNPDGVAPGGILWPRVLDVCDRQLRHVTLGLGGDADGFPHPGHFDITAASEVMAVAALATDREDLRARLSRMVVARDRDGGPLTADRFGAVGAMEVLLKDAMRPNLVQTSEGTPALVHMGPFANIAHGCSSVRATRAALARADYVITEAGFGADLGAEKFVHLKCQQSGLTPAAAVLVLTCSALRKHGGAARGTLATPDPSAVALGMDNVRVHVENLRKLGIPCVASLNRFPVDSDAELSEVRRGCERLGVPLAYCEVFARGGEGGLELARQVKALVDGGAAPARAPLYAESDGLHTKMEALAVGLYRADGVDLAPAAEVSLKAIEQEGYGGLPVCMAKTPLSLSDDPRRVGVPEGFRIQVRDLSVRAGAGFVVALTGAIQTMPGMPRHGAAERISLDAAGEVRGLF